MQTVDAATNPQSYFDQLWGSLGRNPSDLNRLADQQAMEPT